HRARDAGPTGFSALILRSAKRVSKDGRRGEPGDHVPRGEYPIGVVHILYDHTAEGDGISRRPAPPSRLERKKRSGRRAPECGCGFGAPVLWIPAFPAAKAR